MGTSLRSCPQGRRASAYAIASVLRCASHRADARPSHASRKIKTPQAIFPHDPYKLNKKLPATNSFLPFLFDFP
ncbi:MAG: hypothetical protein NZ519_05265 [Bacteroidia bacterium]|nr:hypothetical protein [Bacteroidia bacterium]